MWKRRQVRNNASWLGIARDSNTAYAAKVDCLPGQQPRLLSLTMAPTSHLGQALKSFSDATLLSQAFLCGVFERDQYRLLSVEVPDIPQAEWRDAMRWRLKDYVEFPMDDALLDILAMPEGTQMRQANSAVALVAQRANFNQMAVFADDVNKRWHALDVPETALSTLSAMAAQPDQAHALLVFGETFSMLVITYKGALVMTRTIDVSISEKNTSVDSRGSALGKAALEVLRTLDSYERTHSESPLNVLSIVVPHEGDAVLEVLADLLYIPVEKYLLEQWVDMSAMGEHGKRIGKSGSFTEYVAIGAALRGYCEYQGWQTLQMLDLESLKKHKRPWSSMTGLKLTSAVGGLAIAAGTVMTVSSLWIGHKTKIIEKNLKESSTQLSVVKTPIEIDQLNTMRLRESRQRQLIEAMLSVVQKTQVPYSPYLVALAKQTIPDLWITELKVASSGQDMILVGRMTDPTKLPTFLTRLEQEPQFKGRRFAQVELRAVNDQSDVSVQVIEFILREKPEEKRGAI